MWRSCRTMPRWRIVLCSWDNLSLFKYGEWGWGNRGAAKRRSLAREPVGGYPITRIKRGGIDLIIGVGGICRDCIS